MMSEQEKNVPEQEPVEEITEEITKEIVEVAAEAVNEDDVTVIEDVIVEEIVEDGEVVAEVVETTETIVAEDAETGDVVVEETVDDALVVDDEVVAESVETTETFIAEDAETGEVVVIEVEDAISEGEVPVRKVEGPSTYTPQEFRGRVRRVGNDARLSEIHYKNIPLLTRFLDPRGRILARRKIRVSAKVQRRAAKAIKRARHLALLPYTGEHTRITRKHR
jgi:small subunit ribosomal protein S18